MKSDTNMYEALWCNGAKEVMEFYDYTFEDHFGKGVNLPIYLPRHAVLDYLLTRVTRQCPNFFETYATFETRVDKVTFDSTTKKFTVTTTHVPSKQCRTEVCDKVIWSAGQNGSGKSTLLRLLSGKHLVGEKQCLVFNKPAFYQTLGLSGVSYLGGEWVKTVAFAGNVAHGADIKACKMRLDLVALAALMIWTRLV